jgi:ssDNA-binding Zn-finger/Zn-ribbon topoisomerase 1
MVIAFRCPECQETVSVNEQLAEAHASCPRCRARFCGRAGACRRYKEFRKAHSGLTTQESPW